MKRTAPILIACTVVLAACNADAPVPTDHGMHAHDLPLLDRSTDAALFTAEFLQERPILQAVRHRGPVPPVLLIDEIDRADDEFEALLFEFLGEAAITVPELGTFTAVRPPVVVLTSKTLSDEDRRRLAPHALRILSKQALATGDSADDLRAALSAPTAGEAAP